MAKVRQLKLNNEVVMPALGLGTWMMDGKTIDTAIRIGYRHFDCSAFHDNQAEMGEALQKLFQEGVVKREDLFFTGKLGSAHHAPEDVEVDVRNNLKLLKLDYLDCLQVHPFTSLSTLSSDDMPAYDPKRFARTWQAWGYKRTQTASMMHLPQGDALEAMEAVVAKGLVISIGVTNFSIHKLVNLLKTANIIPAINQIEFHPYLQQPKLRQYCQRQGIAIEAYGPLGSPGRSEDFKKKDEPVVLDDPVVGQIATKHRATPAQICIAFALDQGLAVVPKSSNSQRLTENFDAQEVQLDSEDVDQLRDLDKNSLRLFEFGFFLRSGQTLDSLWDVAEDKAFVLD